MAEAQVNAAEDVLLKTIAEQEPRHPNAPVRVAEPADAEACTQAAQTSATDQEIVTREGFINFVQEYHRRLIYYYLRKHVRLEDAQDLAQEAVLTLWKKRHQSKPPHQSFLFGIARRLYYAYLRTGPNLASLDDMPEIEDKNSPDVVTIILGETSEDPPFDISAEVLAHTSALPQNQRMVIRLIYVEGLSMQEAANTLRISKGSVQIHARRAIAKLRTLVSAGFKK
ncbi:MAG: RNA polymerase sigma factor [Candidatus Sumerlaeia bacterium]